MKKYQFLYLLSSRSIVWCIYSSWEGGKKLPLPAGSSLRHWPPGTNRNRSCRLFFAPKTPTLANQIHRFSLLVSFSQVQGLKCSKERVLLMIRSTKYRWGLLLAVFAVTLASYAQWSNPANEIPAYHPTAAPLKVSTLPPILSGPKLTGENFRYPWQQHVYQQAGKIGNVLYQLPCNCRCDRALGPHQPAQLLRGSARDRVLHLRQGSVLCVSANQAGQDAQPRFALESPGTITMPSISNSNREKSQAVLQTPALQRARHVRSDPARLIFTYRTCHCHTHRLQVSNRPTYFNPDTIYKSESSRI
jgi:hypothetical protein